MRIKNETAIGKILASDGGIFTVKFIKRTDGTVREMRCRTGVKKFTNGAGMDYDPAKKNLVPVFDMELYDEGLKGLRKSDSTYAMQVSEVGSRCYRMVNLEAILELRINGVLYTVEGDRYNFHFSWSGAGGVEMNKVVVARTEAEARTIFKRELELSRLPVRLSIRQGSMVAAPGVDISVSDNLGLKEEK